MANPTGNPIPCPYSVGSTFCLRVTLSSGSTLESQVTVLETYAPFTISPVMRVSLDFTLIPDQKRAPYPLPPELVLKVYDRRFAGDLREQYHLNSPTHETETRYHQYIASGRAPEGRRAIGEEIDTFGSFEACPQELLEHLIATRIGPHFDSEYAAYRRLESLQGREIPKFYGSTEFLDGQSVPGLHLSVRGILLQRIQGTSLENMDPALFNVNNVFMDALRVVDACGDLGVLNQDVRLGNFIVKPDGAVVMIDFAQSRLRKEDEDDLDWKRVKWHEDKEGCVGWAGTKKYGWL
ncbi:hypothetical protein FRC09_004265 [Ceratobasidium sp. 395]|nr:hypothetical protein FRC09_004265 [Ceratobasidium sp. 395]